MGDEYVPCGLKYAVANGDGWVEMRPLDGPVEMSCDERIMLDDSLERHAWESTGEIEIGLDVIDASALMKPFDHRGSVYDLWYRHACKFMSYPRTVRQAKARRKGNRGNRRRKYDTTYFDGVLYGVDLSPNKDWSVSVNWQFREDN